MPGNFCAQEGPVKEILAAVHCRIGSQKFEAWFRHGTQVSLDNGQMKIGAANPFIAGWIEKHFASDLAAAAQQVTGQRLEVRVGVDPQLGGQLRKKQLDAQARQVSRRTSGEGPHEPQPARELRLRHRLADFVVGQSNQLAFTAASAVASGQPSFNPLFIHGTCGVGKTHLLQGVCAAYAETHDGRRPSWKYTTAEQFTNEFVEGLKHKKLEEFRRNYRRLDLLAIDDVHFLAAKKATQEEFLHTFNTIQSAGKQIVMASDAHPRLLGQLTEQLVSRFMSGMVVKVEPPDKPTRIKILQRTAEKLKVTIELEVLEYIAMHLRGSVRELEGALVKLAALAGLAKEPISLELARSGLADHLSQTGGVVTVGDIEAVVAAFFGITPADIRSTRRTHAVSLARAVVMFLARRYTRMSFPEIGRFAGKNHSSVVLAVQRIEAMLKDNQTCTWLTPAGLKSVPIVQMLNLLAEQIA